MDRAPCSPDDEASRLQLVVSVTLPATFSTTERPVGPSLTAPVTARPPSRSRDNLVPWAKTTSGAAAAGAGKWPNSEVTALPSLSVKFPVRTSVVLNNEMWSVTRPLTALPVNLALAAFVIVTVTDPDDDEEATVSMFVAVLTVRVAVGPQGDPTPFGSFNQEAVGPLTVSRRVFADLAPVRSRDEPSGRPSPLVKNANAPGDSLYVLVADSGGGSVALNSPVRAISLAVGGLWALARFNGSRSVAAKTAALRNRLIAARGKKRPPRRGRRGWPMRWGTGLSGTGLSGTGLSGAGRSGAGRSGAGRSGGGVWGAGDMGTGLLEAGGVLG